MKGLYKAALAMLLVAACGRDGAITEPDASKALSPAQGVNALGVDRTTGASIETNQDDYAPGEIVHVVGKGWAPGETVTLSMTEDPDTHADVAMDVQADSVGGFSVHYYDVQEHDLGVTFTLTAAGQTSGSVAVAVFTDGAWNLTIASLSPASPAPSSAFDASGTIAIVGTGSNTWKATEWWIDSGTHTCVDISDITKTPVTSQAFSLTGLTAPATSGPHTLWVRLWETDDCSDPTGPIGSLGGEKSFAFSVQAPANTAPTLTGVPTTAQSIPELALYTFDANATDPDAPPQTLTFSIVGSLPSGSNFNTTTGVFDWTPTEAQGPSGPHTFTVRVSDGTANTDQLVTLNVTEVNEAPTLTGVPTTAQSIPELALYTFDSDASDTDLPAQTLTFSIVGSLPSGATFNTSTGVFQWTPTEAQGPSSHTFTVRVSDGTANTDQLVTLNVLEVNQAPVLGLIGNKSVDEGSLLSFTASATDGDLPANSLTYSLDAGAPAGASINSNTGAFTWTPTDGPTQSQSITVRVTDNGTPALDDFETIYITVNNVAPALSSVTGPATPVPVNTSTSITLNFTDPAGVYDSYSAEVNWDDGVGYVPVGAVTSGGSVTKTFTSAGVYTVCAKVSDEDGGTSNVSCFAYIVVYDPDGGFVTGGGWIMSPAGAYVTDPALTGKATFGFVSKYERNKTLPQGNTEFQFHAASLDFKSTVYEWLVVSGDRAQYKGDGTLNGVTGYGFLLTAIDGSLTGGGGPDKFRIKIVHKASSTVVYDNQVGALDDSPAATALGAGSIVIHTKK